MKRLVTIITVVLITIPIIPGCAAAIVDDPASLVVRRDTGPTPATETGASEVATDDPKDSGTEDTAPIDTGTEDTRIEDTRTSFDSGGTGDPCNDCVYSSCMGELTSCIDDPACSAQMDCLTKCFDAACADKCAADFPSSKVDTLMTCVGTKCGAACSGP